MNRGLTQNNSVSLIPKRSLITAAVLTTLLCSNTVLAGDGELYFGFGFGASNLDPEVEEEGVEIGNGTFAGWKTFIGYDLTNNFSVEGFFADIGHVEVDTTTATEAAADAEESGLDAASSSDFVECDILGECGDTASNSTATGQIDYNIFGAAILYHWPNNLPGLSGFGKLGVAQVKSSSNGITWEKDDSTNAFVGFGAEYQLDNGFSIRGEYEFYDPEAQFMSLNVLKRFGRPAPTPKAPKIADSDNDGVRDGIDQCPATLRGTRVNAAGCAQKAMKKPAPKAPKEELFDTDRDGVPDVKDLCLDTMPGMKVDARGCNKVVAPTPAPIIQPPMIVQPPVLMAPPVMMPEPIIIHEPMMTVEPNSVAIEKFTRVLDGVNFLVGSVDLTEDAKTILNGIADELTAYPEIRVTVVGHTDNTGKAASNKQLSESRALSVAEYLVSRGVIPEQMQYAGKGEEEPISPNSTKLGRSQNRRVELIAEQLY